VSQWVSCRVRSSSQRSLRVRLEISLTPPAVRLTAPRASLVLAPDLKHGSATTTTSSRLTGSKQRLRGDSPQVFAKRGACLGGRSARETWVCLGRLLPQRSRSLASRVSSCRC
jgi:hypothetical protein